MNWTDLTTNWTESVTRLKSRFPLIDETEFSEDPGADNVAAHLARQHDLTPTEAEEEIQDWMFVQSLARQSSDLRSG